MLTVLAANVVQFAAPFIPGLNGVLGIQPLSWSTWLTLAALAITILPLMEVFKATSRQFDVRQNLPPRTSSRRSNKEQTYERVFEQGSDRNRRCLGYRRSYRQGTGPGRRE